MQRSRSVGVVGHSRGGGHTAVIRARWGQDLATGLGAGAAVHANSGTLDTVLSIEPAAGALSPCFFRSCDHASWVARCRNLSWNHV